jgi:hypothetical protein
MYEWSDEHLMLQQAMRDFIAKEILPIKEELEHGDLPPYDMLRKLYATFGMDAMARDRSPSRSPTRRRSSPRARPVDEEPSRHGGGDGRLHPHPDHRAVPPLCPAWSRPWA